MPEHTEPRNGREVHCPKMDRALPPAQHLACPYCFGDERAVSSGDHARYCDFQPGVDPVVFGFPDTHGRHLRA